MASAREIREQLVLAGNEAFSAACFQYLREQHALAFLDEQVGIDEAIPELLGEHDAERAFASSRHAYQCDVVVFLHGHNLITNEMLAVNAAHAKGCAFLADV